jgi:hypothetical protein
MSSSNTDNVENREQREYDFLINSILDLLTNLNQVKISFLLENLDYKPDKIWKAIDEIIFNQLVFVEQVNESDRTQDVIKIKQLTDFHFDD